MTRVLKQVAKWYFKVIQGRWFWHQSKDFPLVLNSNLGHSYLLQREHTKILARIGVRYEKVAFNIQKL